VPAPGPRIFCSGPALLIGTGSWQRLDADLVFHAGFKILRIILEIAESAVERHRAQPVHILPAIEHLEISVDDVDQDAAAHHAVEYVDRLGRVSERAVADVRHLAPRKVSSASAA
jgi:hypothetical protein